MEASYLHPALNLNVPLSSLPRHHHQLPPRSIAISTFPPRSHPVHGNLRTHFPSPPPKLTCISKIPPFSRIQALSISTPPSQPPSSREEAILQARTCLSTALRKPLNNPLSLLPTKKLRKQKQPRFRVEIPVIDDSSESLSQLTRDVLSDMPISRKGKTRVKICILWPDSAASTIAHKLFDEMPESIFHLDVASVDDVSQLGSADVFVFAAPEKSELEKISSVCDAVYPRPAVLFNPKWSFEEEDGFGGGLRGFAASFEVVYSFLGLEVRGILSKRKGVVLRSVVDGIANGGEGWAVWVEEDGKEKNMGKMKVVTRFKKRPAIGDVEGVLYNLMAANSPVTKSVKFFRDMASNVIGGRNDNN